MLDPRRMLTFHEVASRGSFSRAAEALSLTQSAVSQQVAALERELGTRLLHRGRGGLRLTAAGERLLDHAEALAERLRLADAQLAELAAEERRELRIGAFPSALATIVPAALTRLVAGDPGVEVAVHEGRLAELLAGVRDGTLHVALAFHPADDPRREHEPLRRYDLLQEPLVAVLPPRHRLAGRSRLRLGQLAGETWTAPSREGLIARACRAAGFEPRIAIVASDPLAIRAVVEAGLAVTLTPALLADHLHGVRTVPLAGDPPRRVVYAVTPATPLRPLDTAILEHLAAAAGRRRITA
jgi:DNA-binding transcriptional LysR family regulator